MLCSRAGLLPISSLGQSDGTSWFLSHSLICLEREEKYSQAPRTPLSFHAGLHVLNFFFFFFSSQLSKAEQEPCSNRQPLSITSGIPRTLLWVLPFPRAPLGAARGGEELSSQLRGFADLLAVVSPVKQARQLVGFLSSVAPADTCKIFSLSRASWRYLPAETKGVKNRAKTTEELLPPSLPVWVLLQVLGGTGCCWELDGSGPQSWQVLCCGCCSNRVSGRVCHPKW